MIFSFGHRSRDLVVTLYSTITRDSIPDSIDAVNRHCLLVYVCTAADDS